MTGRERVTAILRGRPADRPAWTTLADTRTFDIMPENVRVDNALNFYRVIGCDVMSFGNFAFPKHCRAESPARLVTPPVETDVRTEDDGLRVQTRATPWGTLTATFRSGHPIRHPVESLEELRILLNLWRESRYEPAEGWEETYARADAAIGDMGVYVPTVQPSPVQRLIEFDMGMTHFYYLLQDHPPEMRELLDAMHACRMQEYEILAAHSPAEAIIPVENTSTTMLSPDIYRELSLPQIRDFCDVCHRHGEKAILHMCGLLKDLLPAIGETGLDGINGLTPPPFGDTPFELALDQLGEDLIILGGILDGSVFLKPDVTEEDIRRKLDEIYSAPRIRRANLLLWLPADGLPVPLERFLAVREWMEQHGQGR